jgi:hypothetical protein
MERVRFNVLGACWIGHKVYGRFWQPTWGSARPWQDEAGSIGCWKASTLWPTRVSKHLCLEGTLDQAYPVLWPREGIFALAYLVWTWVASAYSFLISFTYSHNHASNRNMLHMKKIHIDDYLQSFWSFITWKIFNFVLFEAFLAEFCQNHCTLLTVCNFLLGVALPCYSE